MFVVVDIRGSPETFLFALVTYLLNNTMDQSSQARTEDLDQLYSLFEWHPPRLQLAPKIMGGSRSRSSRLPGFYDKHLAPDLICRQLVHVPNLHKKLGSVVDQKIEALRGPDGRIALPPINSDILTSSALRNYQMEEFEHRMKDEKAIVEFYAKTTGALCVRVASTLALHPSQWRSVLVWSASTSQRAKAVCDGSLQVRSYLPYMDDLLGPDRLKELMAVGERYKDLATWEMKSLSVGNGGVMLEVMSMVAAGGPFPWSKCSGSCVREKKARRHQVERALRGADAAESLSFLTTPWSDPEIDNSAYDSQSPRPDSIDDILDRALRRSGSSLEQAQAFNRELEEDGKRHTNFASVAEVDKGPSSPPDTSLTPRSASKVRFVEPEQSDTRRRSSSRKRKFGSENDTRAHEVVTSQSLIQQVIH